MEFWNEKREYSHFEAYFDIVISAPLIISYRQLAMRWGWTDRHVRTFLKEDIFNVALQDGKSVITLSETAAESVNNELKKYITRKKSTPKVARKLSNEEIIAQKKKNLIEEMEPYLDEYGREFMNDFYQYWAEPVQSGGGKIRKDLERTWDIKRRLNTWEKHKNGQYTGKRY